jgi:hypothetical protein
VRAQPTANCSVTEDRHRQPLSPKFVRNKGFHVIDTLHRKKGWDILGRVEVTGSREMNGGETCAPLQHIVTSHHGPRINIKSHPILFLSLWNKTSSSTRRFVLNAGGVLYLVLNLWTIPFSVSKVYDGGISDSIIAGDYLSSCETSRLSAVKLDAALKVDA